MLFDLTDYGLLKVSGNDAPKLLQGQLTCDVTKLINHEATLAAHCNPKGRVIALFHLFLHMNSFYLFMHRSLLPIAKAALQKYALFYKVTLSEDETLTIYGSDEVISQPGTTTIPLHDGSGLNLILSHSSPRDLSTEWQAKKILSRIPTLYTETSGLYLAHELNLIHLQAVDFHKGCFTGQEVIARVQYLCKKKNHLVVARVTGKVSLPRGGDLFTENLPERPQASLVDFTEQNDNTSLLLVVAKEETLSNDSLQLTPEQPLQIITKV